MKRIFPLLVLLSSTAFISARTHETIHSTFEDFSEGKLHQISLHTDGYLLSAPALESFAELDAPILWDAQTDSKGNLYVGTGNQGVIYKVSPGGEVETVFEPNRLMARALVVDSRDRLYVAVSPDGTIYRISKAGVVEVFLKMPDEYVWDLEFGEDDALYVASGSHGIIYRIDTGAKTPEAEVSCSCSSSWRAPLPRS